MEVYLDNSATTRVCAEAAAAAMAAMTDNYGNPSSLHRKGLEAEKIVRKARKQVSAVLGCPPERLTFTSGATEANNLALFGGAKALCRRGRHIIVSAVEHPSVLNAARRLAEEGFEVTELSPNENGEITPQMLTEHLRKDTILVSVMLVNNETGLKFPIPDLVKAVRKHSPNAMFHCDAVQGFGKIPTNAVKWDVDLMTVSGHKIYAPKGIGALYIKQGKRVIPQAAGGGQEAGLRSGTENVPAIAGFGAAVEMISSIREAEYEKYTALQQRMYRLLEKDERILLHKYENSVPYISSISAPTYRSETLLHALEQYGIYLSSGSACSSGKPSHVLKALGLEPKIADGTLRVSFGIDTTEADIDTFTEHLTAALDKLAHN